MEKLLSELEHLSISPRRHIVKGGAGSHRGSGRGRSLDFYGHNTYTPGNDLRFLDWKAYARTENLYVKEFSEEKKLHAAVVLDSSLSMTFGSGEKWRKAKELALALSYLILKQNDLLSLYTLADSLTPLQVRAGGGASAYFALAEQLARKEPTGRTELEALKMLEGKAEELHMLFFISDLFAGGLTEALDFCSYKEWETTILHLLDTEELEPRCSGELKLVELESGTVRRAAIRQKVRDRYKQKLKSYLHHIAAQCQARDIQYLQVSADLHCLEIFKRILVISA